MATSPLNSLVKVAAEDHGTPVLPVEEEGHPLGIHGMSYGEYPFNVQHGGPGPNVALCAVTMDGIH